MLKTIVISCIFSQFVATIIFSEKLETNVANKHNFPADKQALVISDRDNRNERDTETPTTAPYPGTDRRAREHKRRALARSINN